MKRCWVGGCVALVITACAARMARADAGVLVPAGHTQPDGAIFSLNEMTIEIRVDNGDAPPTQLGRGDSGVEEGRGCTTARVCRGKQQQLRLIGGPGN